MYKYSKFSKKSGESKSGNGVPVAGLLGYQKRTPQVLICRFRYYIHSRPNTAAIYDSWVYEGSLFPGHSDAQNRHRGKMPNKEIMYKKVYTLFPPTISSSPPLHSFDFLFWPDSFQCWLLADSSQLLGCTLALRPLVQTDFSFLFFHFPPSLTCSPSLCMAFPSCGLTARGRLTLQIASHQDLLT